MGTKLLLALSLAWIAGGQGAPAGVKVRGRITGVPMDAPAGFVRVVLSSAGGSRDTAVGADGAFEFVNVPPGRAVISAQPVRTPSLVVEVADRDIEGLELTPRSAQLFGQVTIDTGAPLPANRNPLAPVFRLEARDAAGNSVWHQFVRSNGMFGFLPLEAGNYQVRVTLIPAGFAVKSISYAGADALRAPVRLDPARPYAFLRVVLTPAANAPPNLPGPPPAIAETAPNSGDAALMASTSGRGPAYIEGSLAFFSVRSTDNGGFREERRLGGEWCLQLPAAAAARLGAGLSSPRCEPTGAQDGDRTTFFLPAGNYEVTGYVRPCDGNCGALDPPRDECRATFTIRRGESLYAERVQSSSGMCTLTVGSKPR